MLEPTAGRANVGAPPRWDQHARLHIWWLVGALVGALVVGVGASPAAADDAGTASVASPAAPADHESALQQAHDDEVTPAPSPSASHSPDVATPSAAPTDPAPPGPTPSPVVGPTPPVAVGTGSGTPSLGSDAQPPVTSNAS